MAFKFNILDVAHVIGLQIRAGSLGRVEVEAKCPFCNDTSFHLSLNTIKNVYRCNRCRKTGGMLQLYANVFSITTKEANEILDKKLTSSLSFCYSQSANQNISQYATKPLEERDNVYKTLLGMLPLSDIHSHNLKKRGLSIEAIKKYGYRSMPSLPYERMSIVKKISLYHDLCGIPGFFRNSAEEWDMYCKSSIVIPVKDCSGKIQGLQLRLDDTSNRKYRWFSSNYFENGSKAEPWIHVTGNTASTSAYITEGPLKADVASHLSNDRLFIAIPGINCIDMLAGVLKEMGITKVAEALDMDKLIKPEVSKAVDDIRDIVQACGIEYIPFQWNSRFKGIDDYLCSKRAMGQ